LGIDAILIPQGRGVFDVVVDDRLVYSKYETGVFPDNEILVGLLLSEAGND
jgi:predicted Rdx family selenoprotein